MQSNVLITEMRLKWLHPEYKELLKSVGAKAIKFDEKYLYLHFETQEDLERAKKMLDGKIPTLPTAKR